MESCCEKWKIKAVVELRQGNKWDAKKGNFGESENCFEKDKLIVEQKNNLARLL